MGLFLPVAALGVILAVRMNPAFLTLGLVSVALIYLAVSQRAAAEQQLIYALLGDRIKAPGLERVLTGPVQWREQDNA
jgi:hypothetical protein